MWKIIFKLRAGSMAHYIHKTDVRYLSDVIRIQKVLSIHDILLSRNDCNCLWEDYSEMRSAGWLGLPDTDEELWDALSTMLGNIDA
jgi:hypothetical protein